MNRHNWIDVILLALLIVACEAGVCFAATVKLKWSASGDDGMVGRASLYDLRWSLAPITAGNFSSATQVSGMPFPSIAGLTDSMAVANLAGATTHYFALKVYDEAGNGSGVSNVVQYLTAPDPDVTPPTAVTDLRVVTP